MGFDVLDMTGFGAVASHLGLPDAGLATYTDMVSRVGMIAGITRTPLIADGDTGLWRPSMSSTRSAATRRRVQPASSSRTRSSRRSAATRRGARSFRWRMRPARSGRGATAPLQGFPDHRAHGRRTAHGLDEALRRGEAFAKAGADIIFIELPESVEEMRKITSSFHQPLLANMVEGGRTPVLSKTELEELGYKIGLFPGSAFLAAGAALPGRLPAPARPRLDRRLQGRPLRLQGVHPPDGLRAGVELREGQRRGLTPGVGIRPVSRHVGAAVHPQGLAGHVGAGRPEQEQQRADDVAQARRLRLSGIIAE